LTWKPNQSLLKDKYQQKKEAICKSVTVLLNCGMENGIKRNNCTGCHRVHVLLYPLQTKFGRVYWNHPVCPFVCRCNLSKVYF
jgi:hypothetical protein